MIPDLIGYTGMFLVLAAYGGMTLKKFKPNELPYLLLNLSGSIALIYSTWHDSAYPPMYLNIVWSIIGIIGMIQYVRSPKEDKLS